MRLKLTLILLAALAVAPTMHVSAQDLTNASDSVDGLRSKLSDIQDKEAELKIRLEQLKLESKSENIERYFNGVGSVHPEELRESRRRQLQIETDRVVNQLEQLASNRARLEAAITTAQAKVYQQSALGAAVLQSGQDRAPMLRNMARVLIGILVLVLILGSLIWRMSMRRRRQQGP